MKHIIFIIGSLRKNSFNRQLANIVEDMLKERFEISYLDFENIPYMNQDIESDAKKETRQSIDKIRLEIKRCDGIWIFTPEYNHSYPGLLKNLFDWLSRPMDISNFAVPTVIQGKKVTVSGAGGKNRTISCREKLNELLEYIKMDVMKEPQTGIELGLNAWVKGDFHLTDDQKKQLKDQADKFADFVENF